MQKGHDSLIFWLALVFGLVFYEFEYSKIQSLKFDLIAKQDEASFALKYADSICKDGWHSPSSGSGTCSYHGGISTPQHALVSAANMDPEKITDSRVNKLRLLLLLMLACSYFLGPHIENFFKPRKAKQSAARLNKINAPAPKFQALPLPLSSAIANDLTCPKCGKSMIKRIAKKGKSKGKMFFGCSQFPYCSGTKPIN